MSGHLRCVALKSPEELPHGGAGLEVERSHNVNELNCAQATFATLVFRDEGLWLVEARGDTRLRQAALFAKIAQQPTELDLTRRAQRVAHCLKPGATWTASPHNPDLGLSHFRILSRQSRAGCGETKT
jgi:hypothetical protein